MKGSATVTSDGIVERLDAFIKHSVQSNGGRTDVHDPGHRIPFSWPPHAVSRDFHVTDKDWREETTLDLYGEQFDVQLARTPLGVFGRVKGLWNEAKADSEIELFESLRASAAPWFARMDAITDTLGHPSRFHGQIDELGPDDMVVLLYCSDRDVACQATIEIEKNASTGLFNQAILRILHDQEHPNRRSAQWCVLDMLEDINAFFKTREEQRAAIDAIKDLIWRSNDDYARTVYKAGVVLGGHISTDDAADALIECFRAPNKIGRRSAIHGSFHLVEWLPSRRHDVVVALRTAAAADPEPMLQEFARHMADDIAAMSHDHVVEPIFAEER